MRSVSRFATGLALVLAMLVAAPVGAQEITRSIEMPDILDWKSIRTRAVSPDGGWLAYYLAPTEGDSEVVVRSLEDDTEYRFEAGELPMFGGGGIEFSSDSGWVAFRIRPDREAAAKSKKPLPNSLGLVDLASGEMTKFERVRSSAFSGTEVSGLSRLNRSTAVCSSSARAEA